MPELYYITPIGLLALFLVLVAGVFGGLLVGVLVRPCRRPHHECHRVHADDRAGHRPSHRPGRSTRRVHLIGHPRQLDDRTVVDGQVVR